MVEPSVSSETDHGQHSDPVVQEGFMHHQHICQGFDPTMTYFDGRHGTPNEDFLIDLVTDSMERAPDVRPYFYRVGVAVNGIAQPSIGTSLVDYEQERVRAGRLYLAEEQRAGRGMYLASRDWSKWNARGSEWESLPYGPVIGDVCQGVTDRREGEHGLDPWHDDINAARIWSVLKTNIRAPLFPRELLDDSVQPGTRAWEEMVMSGYENHPAIIIAYEETRGCTCRAVRLMTDPYRQWSNDRIWRMYHWDGDTFDEDLVGDSLFQSVAFPPDLKL